MAVAADARDVMYAYRTINITQILKNDIRVGRMVDYSTLLILFV